jgi:hypothetical protein
MRVLALSLTILLAVACGGESDTVGDAAVEPPRSTTGTTTDADEKPLSVVGATRLAKVLTPDWAAVENYTQQFYDGKLEELYESFSDSAKQDFSMQDLVDLRDRMLAEYGREVEVVATRKEEKESYRAFFRAARFSDDERLIEVAWLIGPDGSVGGIYITPDRSDRSTP